MSNKSIKIIIKSKDIKTRKPIAKKPNTVMKSRKDYTRKVKHKGKDNE